MAKPSLSSEGTSLATFARPRPLLLHSKTNFQLHAGLAPSGGEGSIEMSPGEYCFQPVAVDSSSHARLRRLPEQIRIRGGGVFNATYHLASRSSLTFVMHREGRSCRRKLSV